MVAGPANIHGRVRCSYASRSVSAVVLRASSSKLFPSLVSIFGVCLNLEAVGIGEWDCSASCWLVLNLIPTAVC